MGINEVGRIARWLRENWQAPEEYVVGAFAANDVVLLAEEHGVRHFLALVQGLIPRLYAAGVRNLGMEFGAAEDQQELDRLTTGPAYDDDAARRLMRGYNVGWAYREYMEVYRRAWEFNRRLPAGAAPFRVLNLSYKYDWREWRVPKTPDVLRRVFPEGAVDVFRAGVVRREVLERGEKALILTGTIHAFSKYRMPETDPWAPDFALLRDVTLGNHLLALAPGRVWTVLLHVPWQARDLARQVRPLGGLIDEVLAGFADKRVGFDTAPSPFAQIADQDSFYAHGYPDFTLATLADGYIYERPFAEYEGCTVDEGFLTPAGWPAIREQVPDPDWHPRPASLEEYQQRIRDYVNMDLRLAGVR